MDTVVAELGQQGFVATLDQVSGAQNIGIKSGNRNPSESLCSEHKSGNRGAVTLGKGRGWPKKEMEE